MNVIFLDEIPGRPETIRYAIELNRIEIRQALKKGKFVQSIDEADLPRLKEQLAKMGSNFLASPSFCLACGGSGHTAISCVDGRAPKYCSHCQKTKTRDDFHAKRITMVGGHTVKILDEKCKLCQQAQKAAAFDKKFTLDTEARRLIHANRKIIRKGELDTAFIKKLWLQQNGRCALSNAKMTLKPSKYRIALAGRLNDISLHQDNAILIAEAVRNMRFRSGLPPAEFLNLCRQIAKTAND